MHINQLSLLVIIMFKFDRTFPQSNPETDLMEWFFNAREGIYGPFSSKEKAVKAFEEFIKSNVEFSDDGGRSSRSKRFNYGS